MITWMYDRTVRGTWTKGYVDEEVSGLRCIWTKMFVDKERSGQRGLRTKVSGQIHQEKDVCGHRDI